MKSRKAKQAGSNKDQAPLDPPSSVDETVAEGSETPGDQVALDEASAANGGAGAPETGLVEPPEQAMEQLQGKLDDLQNRHVRMAAEYENFRKRTARERGELWSRAQADVVSNILDALDDLGRVLDVDPAQAKAEDVITGVELVERKLVRELESSGLERVGEVGEPFDPNHHEAIGSLPAESEDQDHTVGAVLQLGYKFGGALIRPARVQVFMWQGAPSEGSH